ncbi:MAG: C25 family cysteine peptidase [Bacteroidales bacterium]
MAIERITDGCLIFNYLGHGNELGLARKGSWVEDINSWRNRHRMPVFITQPVNSAGTTGC